MVQISKDTQPVWSEVPDPELFAMEQCLKRLEPLTQEARARVIDWLCDRLAIHGSFASEALNSRREEPKP